MAATARNSMRDYSRLEQFLNDRAGDVYPEPILALHRSITASMLARLAAAGTIAAGQRALDIGCGQGFALERMRALGLDARGAALGADVAVCRAKGLDVREMDQSFLAFGDGEFDFLWCRHVLEHSIFPLFTLSEYHRVLKPGGHAYVEVPAPDTACRHQTNRNHYSVLGRSMWLELFARARLAVQWSTDFNFRVKAGPDVYWAFLLRRPPS